MSRRAGVSRVKAPNAGVMTETAGPLSTAIASIATTNPMTTDGDIIYSSDGSGTPARLGANSTSTRKFLRSVSTSNSGEPAWDTLVVGDTPSLISSAVINLTAANLIAMYGTPVVIEAAVSAKVLVPFCALINFVYGTTQFTGGGDIILQYGTTNHGGGTQVFATIDSSATVFKGTANASIFIPLGTAALTLLANTGIYISNKTAALAAGDSTATVQIWYSTIAQS